MQLLGEKMNNLIEMLKRNRQKFMSLMFIANATVLVTYAFFWGLPIADPVRAGEVAWSGAGRTYSDFLLWQAAAFGTISGDDRMAISIISTWLTVIPIASIYMLFCLFSGSKRFLKTAKVLLVVGHLPAFTLLLAPLKFFGFLLSVVSAISLFFASRVDKQIEKPESDA